MFKLKFKWECGWARNVLNGWIPCACNWLNWWGWVGDGLDFSELNPKANWWLCFEFKWAIEAWDSCVSGLSIWEDGKKCLSAANCAIWAGEVLFDSVIFKSVECFLKFGALYAWGLWCNMNIEAADDDGLEQFGESCLLLLLVEMSEAADEVLEFDETDEDDNEQEPDCFSYRLAGGTWL